MQRFQPDQIETLRARLGEREAQLRAELGSIDGQAQRDAPPLQRGEVDDLGDQGSQQQRNEVRAAEQARDLAELDAITAAQSRLADGSYGRCVDCDADIPVARLLVMPQAGRCAECQERAERSGLTAPASP